MIIAPVHRDIVLVGGGHSHALLIRSWPKRRVPGVRITLVSDGAHAPYSGMLPGWVAGHYGFDDVHIDLLRLCQWAGVRFIDARLTALDPDARTITVQEHDACGARALSRPPLGYDVLSLDTGSTPALDVPGAAEHAVPVKPVHAFHDRWQRVRSRVEAAGQVVNVGVVGSGAGGFELLLAMHHALKGQPCVFHWFLRNSKPVSERPPGVGDRALQAAMRAGVKVHVGFDVVSVQADGVEAADGRFVTLDEVLWCTAAAAPEWPASAGLATDERGFIATDGHLQSLSHPQVFAAGDVGTQLASPSPKAGVYAVRQASVLARNLCRFLLGEPLVPYRAQHTFLSLMALGGQRAIASRPPLVAEGAWAWRWKDYIDRRFMQRFQALPSMPEPARTQPVPQALHEQGSDGRRLDPSAMRCNGCGAKLGQDVLLDVLRGLGAGQDRLDGRSDVARLQLPGSRLVQSVDQLRAMLDDPFLFGRIATLHALSDAWTERVQVHSVQLLVGLPQAAEPVTRREFEALLAGVTCELDVRSIALVGGHTAEAAELNLGLVVNATEQPVRVNGNVVVRQGSAVVLTQAIGVGVLLAAHAEHRVRAEHWQATLQVMLQANDVASKILFDHDAGPVTDVTGFGLLAHAENLVMGTGLKMRWRRQAIPWLPGAWQAASEGTQSSLFEYNSRVLRTLDVQPTLSGVERRLWCDPQTGGGVLAIVPRERVEPCLAALHRAGYPNAVQVGELATQPQSSVHEH